LVKAAPVTTCPFCQIISGDSAAEVLYRDETVLAFRDIRPVAPIHILIIPIEHVASVQELEASRAGVMDRMAAVARRLAAQEGIVGSGYRLVINTGADAGQSVDHLHMHLLAGRRFRWPPG
jgi:histidine triad (HIT) family protein